MADKTELQLKAAEKRLDAIERSIETLKKDSNSNDTSAQLKALSNKVETLTATVKELGCPDGAQEGPQDGDQARGRRTGP